MKSLPPDEYTILNNIMIHTEEGTTQIDHIVVSPYGIFIIETKNYTGWISGSEFSYQWTKSVYRRKYRFKNPIQQNYGHIKAIINLLEKYDESFFIPIVVFSRACELKVKCYKNIVIYYDQLKDIITSYKDNKITIRDMLVITGRLSDSNIVSDEIRKEHVNSVRAKEQTNKDKLQADICPRCGSPLIIRKGKYGQFKGCSAYHKCKFTAAR